jgi:hypothetical protein
MIVISINRDTGARRAIYVMNSGIFNRLTGLTGQRSWGCKMSRNMSHKMSRKTQSLRRGACVALDVRYLRREFTARQL